MTGFEPQASIVKGERSANWVTATTQQTKFYIIHPSSSFL